MSECNYCGALFSPEPTWFECVECRQGGCSDCVNAECKGCAGAVHYDGEGGDSCAPFVGEQYYYVMCSWCEDNASEQYDDEEWTSKRVICSNCGNTVGKVPTPKRFKDDPPSEFPPNDETYSCSACYKGECSECGVEIWKGVNANWSKTNNGWVCDDAYCMAS